MRVTLLGVKDPDETKETEEPSYEQALLLAMQPTKRAGLLALEAGRVSDVQTLMVAAKGVERVLVAVQSKIPQEGT